MASKVLSRRLFARPLASAIRSRTTITLLQQRRASDSATEDPGMNGGYVNPPGIKRQFRDPYENWWDKQERRNFGEPVHEDNDVLGVFSPEQYTHFSAAKSFALIGIFIATVGALVVAVSFTYPDRPAVPREFPDGLEVELGGKHAVRARKAGDPLD